MHQAKQRFLDLDVEEISVVDKPAIEVEFLVTKRMEEKSMEIQDQDATVTETEKNTDGAGVVPVDAPASNNDAAVNKALENVASMVENIAKAAGVKLGEKTEEVKKETSDESTEETEKAKSAPAATPATLRALYQKQLKAAGVSGEALEKAMSEFDKAKFPMQEEKKTTKSDDSDDVQAIKAMEALEQAISKAKSFTPGRVAQLKSVVEQLQKLLAGVMEIPQGASPKTSTPGVGMHSNMSAVQQLTKSMEGLTEAVNKSIQTQADLATRVEAIEKARAPSTALENEGNSTTTETKKGFWEGVL